MTAIDGRTCILFTSPSGVNAGPALRILRDYAEGRDGRLQIAVEKIEQSFIELHSNHFPSDEELSLMGQPGGLRYLLAKPQPYLKRLWDEAAESTFDRIRVHYSAQNVVFLQLHAVYYHTSSRSLFSCVRPDLISNWAQQCSYRITSVVTLIDDIYDGLWRLRKSGHLFDPAWSSLNLGDFPEDLSSMAIEHLRMCLRWREAELLSAGWLAQELGDLPHLLLASKHDSAAAFKLVFNLGRRVYLSHPISRPREQWLEGHTEKWNEFTEQVQEVARGLAEDDTFAPVFPTAIDELRFNREAVEGSQGTRRLEPVPQLIKRWPFPKDGTLYDPPFADEDFEVEEQRLLDPYGDLNSIEREAFVARMRPLVKQLIADIKAQIGARDRWLVSQVEGLVVWRPYFGGRPASGVITEIDHRNRLRSYRPELLSEGASDPGKARCFVLHFPEDLNGIVETRLNALVQQLQTLTFAVQGSSRGLPPTNDELIPLRSDGQLRTYLRTGLITGQPLQSHVDRLYRHAPKVIRNEGGSQTGALAEDQSLPGGRAVAAFWDGIARVVGQDAIEPYLRPGEGDVVWERHFEPKDFVREIAEKLRREKPPADH